MILRHRRVKIGGVQLCLFGCSWLARGRGGGSIGEWSRWREGRWGGEEEGEGGEVRKRAQLTKEGEGRGRGSEAAPGGGGSRRRRNGARVEV